MLARRLTATSTEPSVAAIRAGKTKKQKKGPGQHGCIAMRQTRYQRCGVG